MKSIGAQIKYEKIGNDEVTVEIIPYLIPSKKTILNLWVGAWSFCGLIILISLFTYGFKEDEYIMVGIFLIFWGYFEVKVVSAVVWNRTGREVVTIKNSEFSYLKEMNGRGLPKITPLKNMSDFKYADDVETGIWSDINKSSWMIGGEVIEYNADDGVRRLGMKLPKKDAKQLVQLLNKTARINA